MSQLTRSCYTILDQLTDSVEQLTAEEFIKPSKTLGGSSVGQHLRHTLEFFLCLEQGFEKGFVDYDKRAHDKSIEQKKEIALRTICAIKIFISSLKVEKTLQLQAGYDLMGTESTVVQTTVSREIIYNIEHAIHHMTIMKIGIGEVAPHVVLPPDFGVAASTLRYRKEMLKEVL
ncbi:MAG: hypothetical protein JST43_11010 [Bacteroidetes bacterium]|nr:hypothetical protein [Bacteroidota bacterium]MBS1540088.1 hypothetical protein [Bacteroidota bacterium]